MMRRNTRRVGQVPAHLRPDVELSAAWLYYTEACTQAEVARILGVSRASVANYLASARRRGLVEISLVPDILARAELSRRVAQHFRLEETHLVPARPEGGDSPTLRQRLGTAGAQALIPHLRRDTVLGVAWGRTMSELGAALPQRAFGNLSVVQISGSSLGDETASPEYCTILIARRLGARCYNFHAPAVVTSPSLRAALLEEPPLKRHFERIHGCDIVLFGIGELTPETRWADGDYLIRPSAEDYLRRGSIGALIGRFLDVEGRELQGPLSGRQIGMELEELRAVPKRFCVSGGAEKREAMLAVLSSGYVTHLVTDETMALSLLGEER